MKTLLTLIAAYAICSSIAYAQPDESRDFLYLYSDSVVYARRIDLERGFTGSVYLWVDSRRIHPDQVRFFNNNRGFFANVKDFNARGETAFSERIRKGKVNLYEARTISWDEYDDISGYPHPSVSERKNYYNIGYGRIKKADYVNLSVDLASNTQSMALLHKYRSVKRTQVAMYVAAGASLLAGLIAWTSDGTHISRNMDNRPDLSSDNSLLSGFTSGIILSGIGLGLATGGYFVGQSQTKYLKQAIDAYND